MTIVICTHKSGFPGYDYSAWIGVLGRSGTPQADLAKLEQEILAIGSTEAARSSMYKQDMLLAPKGSADFEEAIAHDAVVTRELVRHIGLKLNQGLTANALPRQRGPVEDIGAAEFGIRKQTPSVPRREL